MTDSRRKKPGPDQSRGTRDDQWRGARSERDVLRRTLSQNLLRDRKAIRQFVDAVEVDPEDLVLEVGAGQGALTVELAASCRELVAYELDPRLAQQLTNEVRGLPNVRVVVQDFLATKPPKEAFRVVGNIPFSVTSAIVDWCLNAERFTSATMITQLEYARKRTGSYGRWSLVTVRSWPWFNWELRGRISRTSFTPQPKVDAGVLHLAARAKPLVPKPQAAAYRRMVELGFTGVGGSLYASLLREYPGKRVAAAFNAAGVDRSTVVAYVTPDEWLALFEFLESKQQPAKKRSNRLVYLG